MTSQLFGVTPADPLTFAAVTLAVLAIGATPSWLPTRPASTVDPNTALRQD